MSHPILGHLTADQFLKDYWQQQACLIRNAFALPCTDFAPDDLAGLACEPLAQARLVSGNQKNGWTVEYGPFNEERFTQLPDEDWTLLVQDVEKHYPPLQQILNAFDFLPRWRLDDLMISFAAPGGSVGPHWDEYDVFLLQASGQRHWQISTQFERELIQGLDLKILRSFNAEQNWLLNPGDMLYLPPGVAHNGIAKNAGMTFSIGLRAPSAADLLGFLTEHYSQDPTEGGRYRDGPLKAADASAEIQPQALAGLREFLQQTLLQPPQKLSRQIGQFLSQYRQAYEPAPAPDLQPPAADDWQQPLYRSPWAQLYWMRNADDPNRAEIFFAGEALPCSAAFAASLCEPDTIILSGEPDITDTLVLQTLLKRGYLVAGPA